MRGGDERSTNPSRTSLSKGRGYFEAHFDNPTGKQHTLSHAEHRLFNNTILFAEWTPHFQLEAEGAEDLLQYPLWAQIRGLPRFLRNEEFLREVINQFATVINQFATVIYVENSDSYRARMLGLRVRIVPLDTITLPDTIIIPKIDGDGGAPHDVVYTGGPDQCERCHKKGHSVKHCPQPRHPNKNP
ncbi:hypothetical protein KC19_VG224900, partial [Ceratodon purpureus]